MSDSGVFNYTDHLGNIRLSYSKDPVTNVLKIMEENHYYPFGLKHSGYNSDELILSRVSSTLKIIPIPPLFLTSYKYKYNGKEYQDELGLNMYDYGARNYDPALGRWMNIDPLAENSRRWTTYNYAYNNPMYFVDPDGMQAMPPGEGINQYIDDDGTFFWNSELEVYERYSKAGDYMGYHPYEESWTPSGTSTYIFSDASRSPDFVLTEDRPDYDGKLTLEEANKWYREGNGEPLLVNSATIDISSLSMDDFSEGVGSSIVNNFGLSSDVETGVIYGSVKVTLENKEGEVTLGNNGYLDTYDFDQKKNDSAKTFIRNVLTKAGEIVAGKGTAYNIFTYGNNKIE